MKPSTLFIIALILCSTGIFAQTDVTKVTVKEETFYLTKTIGYPIIGLYQYESKGDPIVQLNEDGQGIFQLHEGSRTPMVWGVECDEKGVPKEIKVSWGSAYRLWYQIKERHKVNGREMGVIDEWDIIQLSVHTDERKIYILGERIKTY